MQQNKYTKNGFKLQKIPQHVNKHGGIVVVLVVRGATTRRRRQRQQ